MSAFDPRTVLPLLVLGVTVLASLSVQSVTRGESGPLMRLVQAALTVAGLLGAAATLPLTRAASAGPVAALLCFDTQAKVISLLVIGAAVVAVPVASDWFETEESPSDEGYMLISLATLGSLVVAASEHFVAFMLGVELVSMASIASIAAKPRASGVGAALKYLVLGGVATATFVLGTACIYASTGSLYLADAFALVGGGSTALELTGVCLALAAVAFKLAVVPFHLWVGDVYEHAPPWATMVVAAVSKLGVAGMAVRMVHVDPTRGAKVALVLAGASMVVGYVMALRERNLPRALGYASIAHLGYVLATVLGGGPFAASASIHYLLAYGLAVLGLLGLVATVSEFEPRGFGRRHPLLGACAAVLLLSLAGLPPAIGVVAKVHVVMSMAAAQLWGSLAALVVSSALGLYVYLRFVLVMWWPDDAEGGERVGRLPPGALRSGPSLVVVFTTAITVAGLAWPDPHQSLASWVARADGRARDARPSSTP